MSLSLAIATHQRSTAIIMNSIKLLLFAIAMAIVALSVAIPSLATVEVEPVRHSLAAESIGLVAGFGTTFAAFPDFMMMWKNRSTQGMNPRMAAIMGSFQALWLVYGLMIDAPAVIIWNALSVVSNASTVSAYYYFARLEKRS